MTAIRELGPDVRELVLQPLEQPLSYQAGQWISLHLPVGERPLVRAYSLAEPPAPDGSLVLCFDRVKQGLATEYLFGLEVGARLTISRAMGGFVLPDALKPNLMMVSWLTGLVPMRAILLDLERQGRGTRTLVVHGSPTDAERPYHAELVDMAARCTWLRYVPVGLGRDDTTMDDVVAAIPEALRSTFPDATSATLHPMLCGLRALVLPARAYLMETYGFDRKEVQKETYD